MNHLHTRLITPLVIVFLSGLLVMGSIFLHYGNKSLANFRQADLMLHAKSLAQASLDSLWSEDNLLLDKKVASVFHSDKNYAYISLVHPSGKILVHNETGKKGQQMTTVSYTADGLLRRGQYQQRDIIEVIYPVYYNNKLLANTHVAYYADSTSIFDKTSLWQLGLVVLVCLLAIVFISYLVIMNFSRGIKQLTWSMGRVSLEAGYPVNPALEERHDEIGELARTCKTMTDDLLAKYSEMALHLHNKKSIVDTFSDGIIVFDEYGIIESLNLAGEHIFGYSNDELVGQHVRMLLPDSYRDRYEAYLDRYRNIRQTKISGARLQVEGLRKDGSKIPLELVTGLIRHDDKSIFAGTVRDMTSRYEYEQALKMSKDAAEEGNRVKTEFIATMSHELRTPMNAIMGAINLLEDDGISEEQLQYIQMAKKAADDLLAMLDNILDFPGLETANTQLDIVEIDIRHMIDSLINSHLPSIKDKDLVLKSLVENNVANQYRGDATRIRKVISHLLNNAIKFTPSGEIELNVSIAEHDKDRTHIRFEVIDTGIGIDTQDYSRIFDLFTQVDSSSTRVYGGIGIGLAICKRKVEMLGGQIGVISEPGRGSTFWFNIELQNVDKVVQS